MSDQEAAPQSTQETSRAEVCDVLEAGIEEGVAAYHPSGFHPVYNGDIFNGRYQVLNKIGYGTYSTNWLVKDLNHKKGDGPETKFRALKVLRADTYGHGHDTFEREILTHLRNFAPEENTYGQICHMTDTFEHYGPNGTHVCLVLELMGENLRTFGLWWKDYRVPEPVMRKILMHLIFAVDYAHDAGVIHTGKSSTSSKTLENLAHTGTGGRAHQTSSPTTSLSKSDRNEEQYNPVPSRPLRRYYFNEEQSKRVHELDFALGDWGVSSWKDKHLTENITPIALQSPEVLIGAAWDEKTDWWALGAVVIEVFRAVRMFDGRVAPDGHYEVRQHLAQIVDLFGPFPKTLLERGDKKTVEDLFDDDGRVKGLTSSRPPLVDEIWLEGLIEEARVEFASFLQHMMSLTT